jgi:hypothetical protein
MKINRSFAEGFLDGLGTGLFTRLRRPGAPDELIDSRPLEVFLLSDDFLQAAAPDIGDTRAAKDIIRRMIHSVDWGDGEFADAHTIFADGLADKSYDKEQLVADIVRRVLNANHKASEPNGT